MPGRLARALLRAPLTLLYTLLCLGLSALGAGGAYLLLTLGLQVFGNPAVVWAMAGVGIGWAALWLYLLFLVLRAALDDGA